MGGRKQISNAEESVFQVLTSLQAAAIVDKIVGFVGKHN